MKRFSATLNAVMCVGITLAVLCLQGCGTIPGLQDPTSGSRVDLLKSIIIVENAQTAWAGSCQLTAVQAFCKANAVKVSEASQTLTDAAGGAVGLAGKNATQFNDSVRGLISDLAIIVNVNDAIKPMAPVSVTSLKMSKSTDLSAQDWIAIGEAAYQIGTALFQQWQALNANGVPSDAQLQAVLSDLQASNTKLQTVLKAL